MKYRRMPIEIESPEERGYGNLRCNLTESSVRDVRFGDLGIDLDELVLAYGDHRGDPLLRDVIAAQYPGCSADDVVVTPGAAGALFFLASSLLEPGDHLVVARTNYATNLETPRLIGADISSLDLHFDEAFALDLERLAALVRSDTKLISITYPHNPTGAMTDRATLDAVVTLAESTGAWLLVDETYRDMTIGEPLPPVASLTARGISVCSLSKSFGLPGIRTGWAVTRDAELAATLLAAKEQIVITGSGLDEAVAANVLGRRDELLGPILAGIADHRRIVTDWMADQRLIEWVPPGGGVVCFPRLDLSVDVDRFYDHLNGVGGTFVGEGHWFEEDRRYFRLGFGWPTTDELRSGLAAITAATEASVG